LRRTGEPLEPHHRSLKAAIDWSYDFLPPKEQVLLRRLAVFRGGCTLEAAESICAGGEVAGDEVLDLVAGLVDKSLVEVSAGLGCRRYRVHAPVWHYAREKLAASGEERRVLSAHCDHYVTVARAVGSDRDADYPPDSGSPLGEESRNLRAAMEWLGEDGSGGSEAELVLAAALRRLESGPTAP
ncbi:MAG: AfsR/SARP family transcriptional regulator, partial [Anaerolineae bacterium]